MKCNLCPRKCNALRTESENLTGACKMPLLPKVARADLHFWEEPIISGTKGSGTVFFSGCPLQCIYCQNFEVSRGKIGKTITVKRLAEIFKELEDRGAHNINLVSPSHYAWAIMEALKIYRPKIPIVYNCSGYESVETLRALEEYVDIYLIDFKYTDPKSAEKYSGVANYPEIAQNAIRECYRQKDECILENDIMKKGVVIRHLVLPQNTKAAMEVAAWTKKNTPEAYFSLMSQYVPFGEAINHPVLGRKITKREYEKVLSFIYELDFCNAFIQERESSSKEFIPDFSLQGI